MSHISSYPLKKQSKSCFATTCLSMLFLTTFYHLAKPFDGTNHLDSSTHKFKTVSAVVTSLQ